MDEGKISYSSELSEKGFAEGASRIRQEVQGLTNSVEKSGKQIDSVYDNMSQKMKQAFAVGSLVAFQNEIIKVRGEMESLQISFETLAGKQVGKQLYEDIKQFAVNTPMMMGDLAKGAQTMLGFGISAEKIMPILKQLGDVSMGDSQRFNSLALSFSQMSATGKLMANDMNQMISAGFNPLSEISKKTGKSIGQLKEEVEKGAISVQMVEDAFRSATSEGGMFNGMLEKQSKGMAGAISNMKGAYEDMLNDMGEKEQGILVEGTKLATAMLQNYEAIGKVILELIAIYGSYKAAVIVVATAESFLNGQYVLKTRLLRAAAAAQALLNKTMLANPYVLVTAGVLSLISALVIFQNRTEEVSESQKRLNDTFDDTQAKIASEQKNIDALFDKLRNAKKGTDEYKTAKDKILDQYGNYLKGLDQETATLKNVEKAYKAITKAAREAAMARGMESAMKDAQDTYGSAYAENIGKIQEALSKVGTDEASKALKQVQKELKTTGEVSEKTINKIHKLTDGEAKYGWFYNLNAAEQALEQQTKLVEERFAIDEQEEKIEETKQKRNKVVIEEEKKKLQAELENMNKSELQSKEGIAKKQKIAALEKELDEYNVSSSIKAGEKAADEQAKRNAKTVEEEHKYTQQMLDAAKERRRAEMSANISLIKNDAERERAERKAQHEQTLEDIKAQEDEIYKAIYERRKTNYENKTGKSYENTKAGKADWTGVKGTLTSEEKKYFSERYKTIEANLKKEEAEYSRYVLQRYEEDIQALHDYLKEYGSVEQQKYAIAKEYNDRIAKETNEYRKKSLAAERDSAIAQASASNLANSIDWKQTFSGIGNVLEEIAKETLSKVENYMKSAEFKKLTPEGKQSYANLRQTLLDSGAAKANNPFSSSSWNAIASATERYRKATDDLIKSNETAKNIREKLTKAEEEAAENPTDLSKQMEVDKLKKQFEEAGQVVETAATEQQDAQSDLHQQTDSLNKGLGNFQTVLGQITSGTLVGFADGVSNIIMAITGSKNQMQGIAGIFGDAGKQIGGLVGTILSIIDMLGDAPAKFFEDLLDKIATVIEAVIEQLPEIVTSIVKGAGNIVASVGKGIAGLAANIFGGGEDWSAYEEALDKWGGILDAWEDNVEYERKLMEKAYGAKSIEASQKAIDAASKAAQAAQAIYEGWAGSGAGWFSHSNGYNVNEDIDWNRLREYDLGIANAVNEDVRNLFNLTWEQLEELKNHAPQFWASIHSEAQQYLDQYIEAGKEAEDILNALNEKLTGLSANEVFNNFLDSLYDIADGVEDVTNTIAEDWQRMVNKMVINNLIAADMQDQLESWYKRLAELNQQKANGQIGDEAYRRALERLGNEYNKYVSDAQKKIEDYTNAGIIKPIEEAVEESVRGLDTIRDAFASLISDTETSVEDWARNLRNTLITEFIQSALLEDGFEAFTEYWAKNVNEIFDRYNAGEMDDSALNSMMLHWNSILDDYINDISGRAEKMREALGYASGEGNAEEEEEGAFSGLRDTFLNTLADMKGDAKSFRKSIEETMVKDLFDKQILDVPITVNGMSFDDFDAYVADWNERYKAAVADGNTAMLDSLLDELVQVREMTIENAEELRKRLEKVTADTTFSEMSDNWVSTLMDMTKDADDWAQEIGKTIAEKIIKEMVAASTIQPLLDSLQEQFNSAMSSGDTTSVISAILPQLEQIKSAYPQLHEQVKAIMDALGLDTMLAEGFGDMGSIFIDSLTDMEADASTIGKNIAQNLLEQMLSQLVNSKYAEQMKAINEQWREALESGDTKQIDDVRMAMLSLYDTIGNDSSIKKLADELKALGEVAEEEVTTPFDGLRDTFRSALMDMEMSFKDFTNSINQMIAEDFVNDFVMGDAFDQKLKEWKDRYKDITTDGNLTEEQRLTQLKQLGNLISQERDNLSSQTQEIMNMLGLGQHEDQTATMNMAEAATYDQFELYLGMATSHLMVAEQTKELVQQILSSMQTIGGITSPTTNYAQQIFNRLGTTNEYLLETKKLVRAISEKIDTTNSYLSKF